MGVIYDKLLDRLVLHNHIKLVSSDPSVGSDGDMIINTSSHTLKIFYVSEWRDIKTFIVSLSYLLMESGDFLLQENGDKLIL